MHPEGVILTITIMNIVKVLTQVINAALVHFAFNENMGSFASMLLLECALEHAQLIVLMASLFFDAHFMPSYWPSYLRSSLETPAVQPGQSGTPPAMARGWVGP